jgi:hypothetical protein
MKRYSVTRALDHGEVVMCESMEVARAAAKVVPCETFIVTWVGHVGLPAVAAVMWSNGEVEQLETLCLYKEEAERIARQRGPGFFVRDIILNTYFPKE